MPRRTVTDIRKLKGVTPIVVLTAYTAPVAKLLDKYCDVLLVGDSLGMVLYGLESTIPVTTRMMCDHGAAVVRGSEKALVVVDMPFGSYQDTPDHAFRAAVRIVKATGAASVKLEGGTEMAETIRFMTERGIAVMGHIGLKPQSVHADGGYHYHGKSRDDRQKIMEDALAVQEAGAFAVVLEGITESLAAEITAKLAIPTIGIGASVKCDGQVLVIDDMLGFTERAPKFVKRYAELGKTSEEAVAHYAAEVRARTFPGPEHVFEVQG